MFKKKLDIHQLLLGLLITVFTIVTLYLAFNVKMGVSSDSWYHLRVSQKYSETFGIPENGPDTYEWRDISHQPYLFFWINGRVLNLNEVSFLFNEAILLRVLNILYSLGTLFGVYLLSKEFFERKWLRLLPIFLLSNSLMFVMLSSSINYDNLANLFAVFSLLYFVRAIKKKGDWKSVFLILMALSLGSLTKFTILPLAFILVVLMSIFIFKNWTVYKREFKGSVLYLFIPLAILVAMNFGIYGMNLIKFQSLTPGCLDIMTYEQCLSNGVFYRNNVTIPEVEVNPIEMILSGERMDPIRYTGVWILEMTKRIVGIMGDKSLYQPNWILPFYLFYLLIALIMGIVNWKKFNKETKYLSFATLFYLLILLLAQNYMTYLKRGYPTLALQGRYMFPVISSFYVLYVMFLDRIKSKWVQILIFAGLILLFIVGCLPFFFINVDPNWFGSVNY
jgi:4-amino-4-deoxy-L-arabinose transferase-like glycosyltransferase